MEQNIQESTLKQEALQVQVEKIQLGWKKYYSQAMTQIKERFESIDSNTLTKYLEESKIESDKIDKELELIVGDVQRLELDVQSTTST